jgi:hypothetical protein
MSRHWPDASLALLYYQLSVENYKHAGHKQAHHDIAEADLCATKPRYQRVKQHSLN